MNENAKFVLEKRRKVTDFGVRDLDKIRIWEAALRQQGPPLSKYYESWKKVKEQDTLKKVTGKEEMDDYNFVPKMKDMKTKKTKSDEEFKGIFGDDDDEDQVYFVTSNYAWNIPR